MPKPLKKNEQSNPLFGGSNVKIKTANLLQSEMSTSGTAKIPLQKQKKCNMKYIYIDEIEKYVPFPGGQPLDAVQAQQVELIL